MTDLEKEFQKFEKDIEQNISDAKNLEYITTRTASLVKTVFNEIEKIIEYNEEKIKNIENKLDKVEEVLQGIERDIYLDQDLDDEDTINCPYCDSEIPIDYDENLKEIQCPECHNTIELDWNGELDDISGGCSGNCSSCGGCGNDDEDEEE